MIEKIERESGCYATVADYATLHHITKPAVYYWIRQGLLPGVITEAHHRGPYKFHYLIPISTPRPRGEVVSDDTGNGKRRRLFRPGNLRKRGVGVS